MAFISFKDMSEALREDLKIQYREKLPFACAVALTRTAMKCRDLMKDHMQDVFDRPTPYAMNAARAVPATVKTMSAAVLLREFGGKGTPAEYFLGPEIDGGARRQKRSERALQAAGILSTGFETPGSGAAMDAFGNEQSSEVRKILSVLKAYGETGYKANRTKGWNKKTRVGQIFSVKAGSNHGGLKPGVYRRTATGVVCLMRFVKKAPEYKTRLPFYALVEADAAKIFPAELDATLKQFG